MIRKMSLVLIVLSMLFLFAGCVEISIQPDGSVEYKEYIEETFEPSDSFVLDNFAGTVLIEPSIDGKIKIQAVKVLRGFSEERLREIVDEVTVDMDYSASQLVIRTDQLRPRPSGVSSMKVDFRIYLPVETITDIRSSNANIMISGLRGNLKMRTSNGSLVVKDHTGDVIGTSSNGSIQIDGSQGNFDLNTSNAAIELTNIAGSIKADSSNGRIRVDTTDVVLGAYLDTSNSSIEFRGKMVEGNHYEMDTSNGSIQIWIDESLGYDLNAKTSNGRVEFTFPIEIAGSYNSNHLYGQIGGGGTTLTLSTSNGNIKLHKMEDN